jgi:hypothetical protein
MKLFTAFPVLTAIAAFFQGSGGSGIPETSKTEFPVYLRG